MSDFVLGDEIEKHKGQLQGITKALTEGKRADFIAETASLTVSVATGVPMLGPLVKPVVARAFAASANAVLEKQIAEWNQELDRRELVQRLAEAIEVLLGQALIQMIHAQYGTKEEIIDELSGLRADLAGFREDFAARVAATGADVHVEQKLVSGGATGVRVRVSSSKAVRIVHGTVTGPGTTGVEMPASTTIPSAASPLGSRRRRRVEKRPRLRPISHHYSPAAMGLRSLACRIRRHLARPRRAPMQQFTAPKYPNVTRRAMALEPPDCRSSTNIADCVHWAKPRTPCVISPVCTIRGSQR